ncbi:hypothetical protein [Streptomyces griseoloalbus]|uniref:Uncharacterized protein n=1 Tax=Streptomyces griseoloalbus TaxID=67303 RepID=A0A7W8FDM8_9ACTN|nr:hypothetical protein [Streptomyces albaduncus]MBB5129646.1 hypothetical protein [Streptomyces albaduncus]GGW69757.1 hypothetical protein GCM10010340_55040 [Streptomyces albaduncus]
MNDAVPETEGVEPPIVEPPIVEPGSAGPEHAGPQPPPGDDPAAPAPLNVPRTPTGHPEVDAHMERLADADHLTTDGHVGVYEDVHRGLRDALTALDARPGPPAPAGHPTTPQRGPSGHPSTVAHVHRS